MLAWVCDIIIASDVTPSSATSSSVWGIPGVEYRFAHPWEFGHQLPV